MIHIARASLPGSEGAVDVSREIPMTARMLSLSLRWLMSCAENDYSAEVQRRKGRKDPGRGTHERARGTELLRNVLELSASVGLRSAFRTGCNLHRSSSFVWRRRCDWIGVINGKTTSVADIVVVDRTGATACEWRHLDTKIDGERFLGAVFPRP